MFLSHLPEGSHSEHDTLRQPVKPYSLVLWLGLLEVGLHLATDTRYSIFRDELYYIACARHLDFGYVDHPPLIAGITWLVLHLFGSSLCIAPASRLRKWNSCVDDRKNRS